MAAWWSDVESGPDAAHLPDEVTEFVEEDNRRLLHDMELQYELHRASLTEAPTSLDEQTGAPVHAGHFEELRAEAEARGLYIPPQMQRP